MKKLLMSVVMVVGLTVAANAQKKVEVTQEFIDSANKSFTEVVLLRQAVASQETAINALKQVVDAKNETIKIREEQIKFYRDMKCDTTSLMFGLIKNKRCH